MDSISTESTVTGTYDIKVYTPIGVKEGILNLSVKDDELSGTLVNRRGATGLTGGITNGNELKFHARIRTTMGRLKTHVTAKVIDNVILGTAKYPIGSATIEGKKKH